MFNLIKMDLFRLVRSKGFYINFAIIAAFSAIVIYSVGQMMTDAGMGGEFLEGMVKGDITLLQLAKFFYSGSLVPLIIAIGVSIFACSDYSSGYIKNIASGVKSKSTIAISKLFTWAIGSLIYYVLNIAILYIFGMVFIGEIQLGNIMELVQYVGMCYFLTVVIVAMTVMASSLFRNSAAAITFTVVILQFSGLIYDGIKALIDVDLIKYSVANAFARLPMHYTSEWTTLLISGSVFLVVYVIGSCIAMEKLDIK